MKIATIISICLLSGVAFATGSDDDRDPSQEQAQEQKQYQGQEQAVTIESAVAGGQAINEGNDQSVQFNSVSEARAPDILLVPNNNTEKCLRVFGFSFSTQDGGGGIGFPWRSAACDFEQAADDAFAAGERDLGWFWKCQSKNLYKPFRSKGESKESAMTDCQDRMMQGVSQVQVIAMLRDNLAEMNLLRERELEQYRQSRRRCEDTTAKLEENCTK